MLNMVRTALTPLRMRRISHPVTSSSHNPSNGPSYLYYKVELHKAEMIVACEFWSSSQGQIQGQPEVPLGNPKESLEMTDSSEPSPYLVDVEKPTCSFSNVPTAMVEDTSYRDGFFSRTFSLFLEKGTALSRRHKVWYNLSGSILT